MSRLQARQIEAFHAVMVAGSMTQAGEILRISQPAVSRLIADLEAEIGFKLFERRRAGLLATEDARRLYEEVARSYAGLDRISRAAEDISGLKIGHLRVVAMPVFANGLLPAVVARFVAAHPGITVTLEGLPRGKVVDYVASQQCDIGVGTLPAGEDGLRVEQVAAGFAQCVLPAGSALAKLRTVSVKVLADRPFISFPRDSLFRYQIDALFDGAGVRRILSIEAPTSEAVCNLVAAGAGVSVIGPFCPHLERDSRIALRPLQPDLPVDLGVLFPGLRPPSTAAQRFATFVGLECRERYPSGRHP